MSNLICKISNYKYEIIILIFNLILISIFFHSHGNISTDIGREALIPQAILNGDVLYKDILNIYGPTSYFVNAIFYKIFSVKLETLYFAGSFTTIIFSFLIFKVSNFFLSKKISLFISFFIIVSCCYNSGLYNFIMPYSYAVIYGLTSYVIALFFLLTYNSSTKDRYLYLSTLFAGLAFSNKIEFIPIFLLLLMVLLIKRVKIFYYFKIVLCFLIFPFIFYIIPVFQGLSFSDIMYALFIFYKSSIVPSVKNFAFEIGTIFTIKDFYIWTISLFKFSLYLILGFFLFKSAKNKISYFLLLIVLTVFHYMLDGEMHFSYIAVLLAFFLIFNIKNLYNNNFKLFILIFAALGASLKTFFKVSTIEYGAFTFPLLFIALVALIFFIFNEKRKTISELNLEQLIVFFLLGSTISSLTYNLIKRNIYSYPILTNKGKIQTCKIWQISAEKLLLYLQKYTDINDKILILPEGSLFNFLSDRKTDMNLYALNMPYVETYGQSYIVENISNNAFEYIVLLKGFGLYDFNYPNFYFSKNYVTEYLQKNYAIIYSQKDIDSEFIILKRIINHQ